jgi:hypothetical protein
MKNLLPQRGHRKFENLIHAAAQSAIQQNPKTPPGVSGWGLSAKRSDVTKMNATPTGRKPTTEKRRRFLRLR